FIGSSRIPASINAAVLVKKEPSKVIVVAGRGQLTSGMHYQAIKNRLEMFPNYLKGTKVFLEYAGSQIYTTEFSQDELTILEPRLKNANAAPHLLLPHLNFNSFLEFWEKSDNSLKMKMELSLLYASGTYRSSAFTREKFSRLNKPICQKGGDKMTSEGGIRNDELDIAIKKAKTVAKLDKKVLEESDPLTKEEIDLSTLVELHKLITNNGGELIMFRMPEHSIRQKVHNYPKAKANKVVFDAWLASKNISVIETNDFKSSDKDFPDYWHLSIDRRDEFTTLLHEKIIANFPE
ncbi:MAG: hypothetical protein HRT57_10930, partial [Crocinitomicaceae bacterium]|nr:hypothetical protein [Crocinitomicaceae bacterium]